MLLNPRQTDSQPALSDRVFEWLAEQIVTGALRPGQWVSENEVAAQLGVSRSPVHEAFVRFASEGLVEVRRRRGTIMADLDPEVADDLYRARLLIEPEMARMAVEHATEDEVKQAAAIAEEMRGALGDPRAIYMALLHLYQLMLDTCPSATIRDIVAMLWRRSLRFRGIVFRIPSLEPQKEVVAFAEQFVELLQERDGEGASVAMAKLLENTQRSVHEYLVVTIGEQGLATDGAQRLRA
ncbi:GntR family transcriptional regulator [Sinomonas humi]|uniref:GntR family transcriptional regulator n=1 Tax=Sinomonas humi TaxID=1338436 RepID=UPI00068BB654|nr:GntR family transcriptional regulator [Sinomonas humi]